MDKAYNKVGSFHEERAKAYKDGLIDFVDSKGYLIDTKFRHMSHRNIWDKA